MQLIFEIAEKRIGCYYNNKKTIKELSYEFNTLI